MESLYQNPASTTRISLYCGYLFGRARHWGRARHCTAGETAFTHLPCECTAAVAGGRAPLVTAGSDALHIPAEFEIYY